MALAAEYVDDGSAFLPIDPMSINPDFLTDFSLFERHVIQPGKYRFRCLLKDNLSIPRDRLISLLRSWETVYLHREENQNYTEYLKKNLEFILKHDEITVEKKTGALVHASMDVLKEGFQANFAVHENASQVVERIQALITQVIDFISGIESLSGMADLMGHDYDTHAHSIKVGWLMAIFINANQDLFPKFSRDQLKGIMIQAAVAGFLHDIGKTKIPKNIIGKPGKLDNLEYVMIQAHTAYSTSLLYETKLSRYAMQAILYHHENEDGSGYPCCLAGDRIPLLAKICHIADVFDALTARRPYKPAKTPFEALKIMAGENPYLDSLQKFEAEARENRRAPITALVRDDYDAKLKRLREKEIIAEESEKRVEARVRLRDQGMAHCFDRQLLKRFILTIKKSANFNLSGLF